MRQDVLNASYHVEYKGAEKIKRGRKTYVSFHMVNKVGLPYYHVGVDTIDAFCYSSHKILTESELDKAYEDFCLTRNKKQDEKDSIFGFDRALQGLKLFFLGAAQGGSGEATKEEKQQEEEQQDTKEEKLPERTALEKEVISLFDPP